MERLICIVIGYIFGLIQSGYLYGKANHMDIRQYGSGNAGSTNVLRVMGKKAGAIVFLGDFFKAVFAMAVCRLLFKGNADVDLLALYAGLGVTLGHNFPFYLKFKGGKGIACMAGIMTAMDLRITLTCFVIFSVTVFLTRYVSLGSILVSLTFFAELVIFEAARSTLLAMQGDEKLPSLKTLQAEQAQLFEEQERLYAERNRLKKEVKQIETIKSNVDTFLSPSADHDRDHRRSTQRE